MRVSETRVRAMGNFKIRIPVDNDVENWLIIGVPEKYFGLIDEFINWVSLVDAGFVGKASRLFTLPFNYSFTQGVGQHRGLVAHIVDQNIAFYSQGADYADEESQPLGVVDALEFISQIGIILGAPAAIHISYNRWQLKGIHEDRYHVFVNEETKRNIVFDDVTLAAAYSITTPDGDATFNLMPIRGILGNEPGSNDGIVHHAADALKKFAVS